MSNDTFSIEAFGVLKGHKGAVTSLVCGITSDNQPLLISGSRDKTIIKWELDFENKKVVINEVEKQDGTKERQFILPKVGKPIKSFHGHNHFVSSLALSKDSKSLLSGSWDKTIRLWDVESGRCQKTFIGHNKDVLSVAFSHDERIIFSGSMDNTLKYWNTLGALKYDNSRFNGWVSSIVNIKKGKKNLMAVGSWDSSVQILNSEYNIEGEIPGNDYAVTSMCGDGEGDFIFIAYKNGTVKFFGLDDKDGQDKQPNYILQKEIDTNVDINAIKFDNAYFEVFALGTSQGLQIRKIKGGENPSFVDKSSGACLSLCYDNSKKYLFAGFANGDIKVYKTSNSGEN